MLERLVGSVRERADMRMYTVVAKQVRRADPDLPGAAMWAAVAEIADVSKEQVRAALEVVKELVSEEDGAAEAAIRAALVEKYHTVRPFLRLLGESKAPVGGAGRAARAGRGAPVAGAVAAAGEQEAAVAQGD